MARHNSVAQRKRAQLIKHLERLRKEYLRVLVARNNATTATQAELYDNILTSLKHKISVLEANV